ncbi:MAG: DUF882 domain-containing protein [Methylotenera sp.]
MKDKISKDPICNYRRNLLKGSMALALASLSRPTFAAFQPQSVEAQAKETVVRELAFHNLHTGENLKAEYWSEGGYLPDALAGIDHILRDFRTNQVLPIDPQLLDLLHNLRSTLGTNQPFQIISGYRSPATNANLAANSDGVAKKSLHMQGKAIDLRVEGTALKDLRQAALSLQGGGVGYYPGSNFVHVDIGRLRSW